MCLHHDALNFRRDNEHTDTAVTITVYTVYHDNHLFHIKIQVWPVAGSLEHFSFL